MVRPFAGRRRSLLAVFVVVLVVVGLCLASADRVRDRDVPQPVATPAPVPTTTTPYLPFDMPAESTDKLVFAHYVPWIPISIDNLPSDDDYYSTQLMTPYGENGKHAAYGGYLRDRPMPRAPLDRPDWREADVRTEITEAQSIGIDGFAVDVLVPASVNDAATRVLDVAGQVGDFRVQVTADMSGTFGANFGEDAFAAEFAPFLRHPAAQRLRDGRVVFGAFFAEKKPVEWWQNVLSILRARYGLDVAFVPTFLDAAEFMDAFAPISYGFSNWGGRNPASMSASSHGPGSAQALARHAETLDRLWMQPIPFQDNRPNGGVYEESQNGVTNRNAWRIARDSRAEWVNLITWNDFAELTAIAPSPRHGWALADRTAYFVARFKYGAFPPIVRDALYVSHRTQPHAASPTFPETMLMKNIGETPARDTVEVESFARAPATLVATIGGVRQSCDVPAGFAECTFPLGIGEVSVTMRRDDADAVTVRSREMVTDRPYVQDMQYVVAGGLR